MKKELSPAAIICIIIGVVAAVATGVFFLIRSDPAAQGPHPPPHFDPAAREATEARNQAMITKPASSGTAVGQSAPSVPPPPPGTHPSNTRPVDERPTDLRPQVN